MIRTMREYTYKDYSIFLMNDGGAHWYELYKGNEFFGNFDSYDEAKAEILKMEGSS